MKVITEREMFEACIPSGCSTSRDASGNYEDDEVNAWWYGWKKRADAEKARDTVNALDAWDRIKFDFPELSEEDKKNRVLRLDVVMNSR